MGSGPQPQKEIELSTFNNIIVSRYQLIPIQIYNPYRYDT
jgi:hypothetical protein